MKKIFVITLFLVTIFIAQAQKTFVVGTTRVIVPGDMVSVIELVNHANKNIGYMTTYTNFEDGVATFTSVSSSEGKAYLITQQIVTKNELQGLNSDIEVKKAFADPEMKTKPKIYWQVSVGFRLANNDVAEVGKTIDVRDGGQKNEYKGTSYLVPFVDKKSADAFVLKIKDLIK